MMFIHTGGAIYTNFNVNSRIPVGLQDLMPPFTRNTVRDLTFQPTTLRVQHKKRAEDYFYLSAGACYNQYFYVLDILTQNLNLVLTSMPKLSNNNLHKN